jgi:hypothetical protein
LQHALYISRPQQAPAWKWGLAITPLYGIIIGVPGVENVDMNQSLALAFTGVVWSYYATLVRPRANLLLAVNIALLGVNGYNVVRKYRYDQTVKAAAGVVEITDEAKSATA